MALFLAHFCPMTTRVPHTVVMVQAPALLRAVIANHLVSWPGLPLGQPIVVRNSAMPAREREHTLLTVTCKHVPASFLPRTHVGMISGEGHSPYLRPPPPLVCFGVADPELVRGLAQTHSSCVHVCTHVTWSPAVRTMATGR